MLKRFSSILLVDDSAVSRKIVRHMLSQQGFDNIDDVAGGQEALSRIRTKTYRLVISDWNMDPMNGLELLAAIRGLGAPNPPLFVMMTGHVVKFASIARDQGSVHYLAKPFTAAQLLEKIRGAEEASPRADLSRAARR